MRLARALRKAEQRVGALNLLQLSILNHHAESQALRVRRNAGHDPGIFCRTTALSGKEKSRGNFQLIKSFRGKSKRGILADASL
jgi:hypothetical protein